MTLNPQTALILPGGCEAQPCNNIIWNYDHDVYPSPEWQEFEAANPPLKTTKEYKHLAGKVVNVVEVWQWYDSISDYWHKAASENYSWYKTFDAYSKHYLEDSYKTRRAFEVLSEEESKQKQYKCIKNFTGFTGKSYIKNYVYNEPEIHIRYQSNFNQFFEEYQQTVNSFEEAAEKYAHKKHSVEIHKDDFSMMQFLKASIATSEIDFIAGASHIINSGEYVKVSDVVSILQKEIDTVGNDLVIICLQDVLNEILELKNNK